MLYIFVLVFFFVKFYKKKRHKSITFLTENSKTKNKEKKNIPFLHSIVNSKKKSYSMLRKMLPNFGFSIQSKTQKTYQTSIHAVVVSFQHHHQNQKFN